MEDKEDCGCTEKRWLLGRILLGGGIGAVLGAGICVLAHAGSSLAWLSAAVGFGVGSLVAYRSRSV